MKEFATQEEETRYGRALILEIVNAAKTGHRYKKLIKEMWDIAERNPQVLELVEYLILSLHKTNGARQ
jgi:hypothetical protein